MGRELYSCQRMSARHLLSSSWPALWPGGCSDPPVTHELMGRPEQGRTSAFFPLVSPDVDGLQGPSGCSWSLGPFAFLFLKAPGLLGIWRCPCGSREQAGYEGNLETLWPELELQPGSRSSLLLSQLGIQPPLHAVSCSTQKGPFS